MCEVIVITSGKGGVGKTTTTANIGTGLAAQGKRVVFETHFRVGGRSEDGDSHSGDLVGGRFCCGGGDGGRETAVHGQGLGQENGGKNRFGTARQNFRGGSAGGERGRIDARDGGYGAREDLRAGRRGDFGVDGAGIYQKRKRAGGQKSARFGGDDGGRDHHESPARGIRHIRRGYPVAGTQG